MRTFSLEQSVLATVAYFDQFDFPLTYFEVWNYLLLPDRSDHSLSDVLSVIDDSMLLKKHLVVRDGRCCLRGREDIISTRNHRYIVAERKWRKAIPVIRLLASMPFVRMIGMCNELALSNAREESDIDLYIIVRHRYLWIARFFCQTLTAIMGVRPTKTSRADTICLSFFADEDARVMSELFLSERDGVGDVYFSLWMNSLIPIYDDGGYYERWLHCNEDCLRMTPNFLNRTAHNRREVRLGFLGRLTKSIFEGLFFVLGGPGRNILRAVQMYIMPKELKSMANIDTRVVIDDEYLKFHENDRREKYRQGLMDRLNSLLADPV